MDKVITALMILGNPDNVALILLGKYDEELRHLAYYKLFGAPVNPDHLILLNEPEIWKAVANLKNYFRHRIQIEIDRMHEELKLAQHKEVIERVRSIHKPTQYGTTADIAVKYNLSKSQVRKMRAEGTLDGLCAGDSLLKELE